MVPNCSGATCTRAPASRMSFLLGRTCGLTYAPTTLRLDSNANVSGQFATGTMVDVSVSYLRGHGNGRRVSSYGDMNVDGLPGPCRLAPESSGSHSVNASAPYSTRTGLATSMSPSSAPPTR